MKNRISRILSILNFSHHTSFGSLIENRSWSASKAYRYSFNGMERDDNVKGKGNSLSTFHRIYDSRLGIWLSIDPESDNLPSFSPYTMAYNNPIIYKDENGDIGVLGFLLAAGVEVAGQMIANKISGDPLNRINWANVAIAGFSGAIGIPPTASMVKYGKTAHKLAKIAAKHWDDAAQSLTGFNEHGEYGIQKLDDMLTTFGVAKVSKGIVGQGTKRLVKAIDVQNQAAKKTVNQTKKAVQKSQASLDRTAQKRNYKNQEQAIERKQTNLNKALDDHSRAQMNAAVGEAASKVAEEAQDVSTHALGAKIKNEIYNGPTSFAYKPERLGNSDMYFVNSDHTQVYDNSSKTLYDVEDKKLSNGKRTHINVNQYQIERKQ